MRYSTVVNKDKALPERSADAGKASSIESIPGLSVSPSLKVYFPPVKNKVSAARATTARSETLR